MKGVLVNDQWMTAMGHLAVPSHFDIVGDHKNREKYAHIIESVFIGLDLHGSPFVPTLEQLTTIFSDSKAFNQHKQLSESKIVNLIPCHSGGIHWRLLILDLPRRMILLWDPYGSNFNKPEDPILIEALESK
jgi:hypothetical protein